MSYSSTDIERIERYARHAANNALSLVGYVRVLRSRPSFETRAEEAIGIAESELEAALIIVRKARAEFSAKPVTA